jgi:hypothetical protein
MANEILYTGQLTETEFLDLLKVCHGAKMFAEALVLAEQFPDHVIKKKEQQDLLFFEPAISHIPWEEDAVQWHAYISGRIFTDQWELRWVRQQSEIRVVYLGVSEYSGTLRDYKLENSAERPEPLLPDALKTQQKPYYLFGERLRQGDVNKIVGAKQGDFAEARIPRLLRYPPANCREQKDQQKKRYMQLLVREYVDGAGNVVLSRFQCLNAIGRREE